MGSKRNGRPVNPAAADDGQPWLGSGWSLAVFVAAEVALGSLVLRLSGPQGTEPLPPAASPTPSVATAEVALDDAHRMARWVAASGDAGRRPFVVVDKIGARVLAFDAQGRETHAAPILLGLARGDDSVPGIGDRPVMEVKPAERITPAGRFLARPGRNLSGEDIVWVDYDAAVSMHRVRAINPKERRLERLASPTAEDNRISYGCINLPVAFYEQVLRPLVDAGPTLVYVLPETRPLEAQFAGMAPAGAGTMRVRHASL
jgi:hypothetical protein